MSKIENSTKEAEKKMSRALQYRNTTSRARDRVKGSGPDRKLLPAFKLLCTIPQEYIMELVTFFAENKAINDLRQPEKYGVSQHCPLRFATPEGFHHLLLTHCIEGEDDRLESNYRQWTDQAKALKFSKWFSEKFPNAFRVRLSSLKAHTEFGWHIDTNTSVACRCSASINSA